MRYAQYIVAGALLWAVTACSSKPSEEFIKSVQEEYQSVEKGIADRIAQVESQVSALKDPFAGLKSELGKVWTDKVEKDKEISEKLQAVAQKVQEVEAALNTAKSDLNSALSEAKAFVDGLASQQKKDEELKGEWEAQKSKLDEKQGALDQVAQSVSAVQQEVSTLSEEIKKKYAQKK